MSELTEPIKQEKEITIENPIGGELILGEVKENTKSKKKYKEIFVSEAALIGSNITQGALQVANQSETLAQIIKQAPNGLFTATVDPSKLSKFKNGTFTTMYRNDNKLKHAGFSKVALKQAINPAMVLSAGMQAMSMVAGTYYLKQLNSQIVKIDNKLEELLKVHHDENVGKLIATRKGLSDIAVRDSVDSVDLNTIRVYKKTADEIQEGYSYSLQRKENELVNSKKVTESKLSEINFYMSISFEASRLSLFSQLTEICTRMKIGGQFELLEGLTKQLKNSYSSSFYRNAQKESDEFYSRLQAKFEKERATKKSSNLKVNSWVDDVPVWNWSGLGIKAATKSAFVVKGIVDESSAKKKEGIRQAKSDQVRVGIVNNKRNETFDKTIKELIKLPYKKSEILYIPDSERQRVFVPVE
jgi:hypothetical protein